MHLIFSTKDRFPLLGQEDLLSRTHAYLGGILRDMNCPSLVVGGTADHVHAFFQLSRTQHVAKVVVRRAVRLGLDPRSSSLSALRPWGHGIPRPRRLSLG
jgi:REP element-mobilizing transposase RayT